MSSENDALVEELVGLIGERTIKVRKQENYSGEHREWLETMRIPDRNPMFYEIARALLPIIEAREKLARDAGMEQAAVMLDTATKDEHDRAEANKGTQLGSCAAYAALAFKQEATAIRQAIGATDAKS